MHKLISPIVLALVLSVSLVAATGDLGSGHSSDWKSLDSSSGSEVSSDSSSSSSSSSISSTSSGGHPNCRTVWVWNGKDYVKRNVVYRQKWHMGKLYDNVMRGSQCKVLDKKPTVKGVLGLPADLTPLPMNWWTNSQAKDI